LYIRARATGYVNQQDCFITLQKYQFMSDDSRNGEMGRRVFDCLTPDRRGAAPQRALFAVGDSRMAQKVRSFQMAVDGAASVVWSATAFGVCLAANSTTSPPPPHPTQSRPQDTFVQQHGPHCG
jgi:hypothetical protein